MDEKKSYMMNMQLEVVTDDGDFITGDYFEGISDFELKHCRSGRVVRMSRETMKDFFCVGDYDKSMAQPCLQNVWK